MTRTHKWGVHEHAPELRFFTHNGHLHTDPNRVRKNGCGRHNWGQPGDEIADEAGFDEQAFFGRSNRRNLNHETNETNMKELSVECDARTMGHA